MDVSLKSSPDWSETGAGGAKGRRRERGRREVHCFDAGALDEDDCRIRSMSWSRLSRVRPKPCSTVLGHLMKFTAAERQTQPQPDFMLRPLCFTEAHEAPGSP